MKCAYDFELVLRPDGEMRNNIPNKYKSLRGFSFFDESQLHEPER